MGEITTGTLISEKISCSHDECHNYWQTNKSLIQQIITDTQTPVYIYSEHLIKRRVDFVKSNLFGPIAKEIEATTEEPGAGVEVSEELGAGVEVSAKDTTEVSPDPVDTDLIDIVRNTKIYYSLLCNSNTYIIKSVKEAGIDGVIVTSRGEYFLAFQTGIKNENIIISFAGLTKDDLDHFNVFFQNITDENKYPIIMINSEQQAEVIVSNLPMIPWLRKIKFGIRVRMDDNSCIGGVLTDGLCLDFTSRIGIPQSDIDGVIGKLSSVKHQIKGLCTYACTNVTSHRQPVFYRVIDKFIGLSSNLVTSHGLNLEFIDIGGGYGIPFHTSKNNNEREFDFKSLRTFLLQNKSLRTLVDETRKKTNKQLQLFLEPGAYIMAPSGIMVTRIIERRDEPKNNPIAHSFVADTSFSVFVRPNTYEDKLGHRLMFISSGSLGNTDGSIKACIVANTMEERDCAGKNIEWDDVMKLEDMGIGDAFIVMDTGSYSFGMSTNYGGVLKPSEILITGDNKGAFEIRLREDVNDLVRKIPFAPRSITMKPQQSKSTQH